MWWLKILGAVWIIYGQARAQQHIGMGGSSGILDTALLDPLNYSENPASIGNISTVQYGIAAARYKDVRGLNFFSGCIAFPLSQTGIALLLHHSGTAGLQENQFDLLFARDLGGLLLGIQINASFMTIRSVGGYKNMAAGVGFAKTSGQLTIGICMSRIALLNGNVRGPGVHGLRIGMQAEFKLSPLVSLGVSASKLPGRQLILQPEIYYRSGKLQFSAGFDVNAGNIYLQTSLVQKKFHFRFLFGYQPVLGVLEGTQILFKNSSQ